MTNKGKLGTILAAGLAVLALWPGRLGAMPLGPDGPDLRFSLNGDYAITSADDQNNGFGAGASLSLALNRYISLELNAQFTSLETTGTTAGTGAILQAGRLRQIPVQLLVQIRLPLARLPLVPYATAGAGYSLNSFSLDETLISSFSDLGIDVTEDVSNSFVWTVGAGIDFLASPRLVINVHALYRSCSTDATWTFADQVSGESSQGTLADVGLKDFVLGLGIGYRFQP
jgi:outer membrane protein W